ncbi:c-type cytochrome biogenesis protein CcmI [Rhodobacteraceae bacterium LMO-12]|nr:c-type cytochrome biogenesis protein CcmI [Rhodobacteraceae bacterium LMO-JJ12]
MVFWITAAALAIAVATILVLTLLRTKTAEAHPAEYDLRVYRDQLSEVERDLARGIIAQDDAERIRAEVGRRILAADTQLKKAMVGTSQPRTATITLSAIVVLGLVGGTALLYPLLGNPGARDTPLTARIEASDQMRAERPSQAEAETQFPTQPSTAPEPRFADLMEKLRKTVADRPDDLQGQQLLARNEASIGNYKASYAAQSAVIRIKGDSATAADYATLAEMMIRATDGYVSPEAEDALRQTLTRDPRFPPARYFTALMHAQNDRPDIAFRLMEQLLSDSTPDAPWVPAIRAQIEELAWRAGVRYSLPEAVGTPAGPSADDLAAADDMSPEERQEMIQGMVDGLAERLNSEGGTAEEWARLISSQSTLGNRDAAQAALAQAEQALGDDAAAMATLRAAAVAAGLSE